MSTRFPGNVASRLTRPLDPPVVPSLPASYPITYAGFQRISVDRNDYSTMMGQQTLAGDYQMVETDADGVTPLFLDTPGSTAVGPALTVGVWYFIAATSNGTTNRLYVGNADTGAAFTVATVAGPGGAARVMELLYYGANETGGGPIEPLNGELCGMRLWFAELSQAQLQIERTRYNPFLLTDLWGFWPMSTEPSCLDDYGGQGIPLIAPGVGTRSTGGQPLQPWVVNPFGEKTMRLTGHGALATFSGGSGPNGWQGTPVITGLGNGTARITGVSLNAGGVGTIGLYGSGADIELPSYFLSSSTPTLTLSDLIEARYQQDSGGASHINVDKSEGPFTLTFTNAQGQASGDLEIYVRYHHSIER